jgi:hypothetical protein
MTFPLDSLQPPQKNDVDEQAQVSINVGLLCNERPGVAGLPFILSSESIILSKHTLD